MTDPDTPQTTPTTETTAPATEADRDAIFVRERAHLLAVAFRILGSEADAQDIVQEAWLKYARADLGDIRNVPAWLTTVVSRLCLDHLRHARFVNPEADVSATPGGDDPEEIAVLASELTDAWLIVLDALTPPQRVALILHDVFGVPFTEVGHVLDTTPDAAKKHASRARGRLRLRPPVSASSTDARTARRVVRAFMAAAQQGDLDGLVRLLDPNVVRTADPQLLPAGAPQRIRGAQIVARSALQANRLLVETRPIRLATLNGRPGVVVLAEHGPVIALAFRLTGERIRHIDVIADPQRLAHLRITH